MAPGRGNSLLRAASPFAHRAKLFPVEFGGFLALFLLYYVGRGLPTDRVQLATDNALSLVDFERDIGIFRELGWQRFAFEHGSLKGATEFTYSYLHLPVLACIGFAVYCIDTRKYRVLRNALLVSGFLGMAFYWFVPVTPPRLLAEAGYDLGFIDPIGPGRLKPGPLTNHYAALPSYHFGWIMLGVIGIWWVTASVAVRAVSAAFLFFMAFSIIATANHYFVDLILGAVMVLIALWIAAGMERAFDARPGLVRRVALRCGPVRFPF